MLQWDTMTNSLAKMQFKDVGNRVSGTGTGAPGFLTDMVPERIPCLGCSFF